MVAFDSTGAALTALVVTATDGGDALPARLALEANYPDPSNPATIIPFDVQALVRVRLPVYDVLGREVAVPVDEERPAGRYAIPFDAGTLPSGVYRYRIEMGPFRDMKTMLLVKCRGTPPVCPYGPWTMDDRR